MPTYYFDASDAAATDPLAAWTNDANAFDGSFLTNATTTSDGAGNILKAEGTNAPATGLIISSVKARIWGFRSGSATSMAVNIYTNGLAETLATYSGTLSSTAGGDWSAYTTLNSPAAGWSWSVVQALEITLAPENALARTIEIYRIDVLVEVESIPGALYMKQGFQ